MIEEKMDLAPFVMEWLNEEMTDDGMPAKLRTWFGRQVPKIYSPKPNCDPLNIKFDAEQELTQYLSQYITKSSDPQSVFEQLKKSDTPSQLCGRVFKSGEPTYSCRDCGLDPTCVLCVTCFKLSPHRSHRYKMSMSGGGGYCDCGDREAWKQHAFCDYHYQGYLHAKKTADDSQNSEKIFTEIDNQPLGASEAIKRLPEDLADRVQCVFRTSLRYAHEMLTWEHGLNLPIDLQHKPSAEEQLQGSSSIGSEQESEQTDNFVTMLFNDEIHTYEQVIQTLMRAIECNQKQATEFASTIDREGRSIVKCAQFAVCQQVKTMIERITSRQGSKPLKVEVMHTSVVAHQTFAMRLLEWLQGLLGWCEGFRAMFGKIMMEGYAPSSWQPSSSEPLLLECVMKSDTTLWKTARTQWHQLFISGMLMESRSKKYFAKVFTRIYTSLMKEFIQDDHEHSISITSLSVQFFTVPTLAHALIAEEDALAVLLKGFLSECSKHKNHDGKLAFERNHNTILAFRRAQYIIYDVKYLLSVKPSHWSVPLRKNVLHGLSVLLELLSMMQGMDSVVRQVGQHVEFEAEWETGINLQLKMAPVISLFIDWCASDRDVLIRALRAAVKMLVETTKKMSYTAWELCGIRTSCIDYDVSTLPVTVHIPLTRFVAGILLHLAKHDLHYDSAPFKEIEKPSPVELMELPLRTQVMVSQFRAGMWRRNGYSLINQVHFYQSVRLRDEMYDRDILMLQTVACMMDSNHFLIQVLNKFNLLFWAQENYEGLNRRPEEDFVRQTVSLVEEFLGLILTIISERHMPGVGKVTAGDRIKKEVIQWLSLEPMTHSELVRYLPKDVTSFESGIENVISQVATFKRPSPGSQTGKYELKPEYYKDFNPFYYHYSRQEQSKAEEVQLKRKKTSGEPYICCPPPIPPDLAPQFQGLSSLLTSDVMLHLMTLVLKRTINLHTNSFSETQFEKILHLIGVALHEEEKNMEGVRFTELATEKKIHEMLEICLDLPRSESHKDLLKWVVRRFISVTQKRKGAPTGRDLDTSSGSKFPRLASELDPAQATSLEVMGPKKQDRKKNSEEAAARRARIMAQMMQQQKKFISENPEYFKQQEESANSFTGPSSVSSSGGSSWSLMEVEDSKDSKEPVAVGRNQRGKTIQVERHTCILCREEQDISTSGRCMVFAGFVQRSTVLSKNRKRKIWTDSSSSSNNNNSSAENPSASSQGSSIHSLLMPADLYSGPHISTCGHVMHADCWQKFFDSVLAKERRRPLRYGRHVSFDVDKHEFLCPLCECLSNTIIPIIPPLDINCDDFQKCKSISLSDWLVSLRTACSEAQTLWIKDPTAAVDSSEKFISRFKAHSLSQVLQGLSPETSREFASVMEAYVREISPLNADHTLSFSSTLMDMMRVLAQAAYTIGLNIHPNPEDERLPLMTYSAVAFTIHTIERLCRVEGKPIFGDQSSRKFLCLQALVRFAGSSSAVFKRELIHSHAVRILRYLLINEHYLQSPSCCLDIDAFGLLVTLVLTAPTFYLPSDEPLQGGESSSHKLLVNDAILSPPTGGIFDAHYIHLVLVFHLVQIILSNKDNEKLSSCKKKASTPLDTKSETSNEEPMDVDALPNTSTTAGRVTGDSQTPESPSQAKCKYLPFTERLVVAQFYKDVLKAAGIHQPSIPDDEELVLFFKSNLLPFLRCSAVLFSFLTNVTPPSLLSSSGSSLAGSSTSATPDPTPGTSSSTSGSVLCINPLEEFKCLCTYLGLSSNMSLLLDCTQLKQLALNWVRHPRVNILATMDPNADVKDGPSDLPLVLIKQPHDPNTLIKLPQDFSELINGVSQFSCPNSEGDDSRTPTLCLVCGQMICSQSYCCQTDMDGLMVGGCTYHAHHCGSGVGIFLRIRDCRVLLLSGKTKGCYQPPPYIDEYGETDQGLSRGNPLHLCESSYQHFHRLWLRHAIPETIAHQLELHSSLSATNWHMY